jgi:hypothetical protein
MKEPRELAVVLDDEDLHGAAQPLWPTRRSRRRSEA